MEFRIEDPGIDDADKDVLFVRLRKSNIGGLVWEGRQLQHDSWTHIAWINSKSEVVVGAYLNDLKLKKR